jgi:hypothetical protein
LRVLLSTQLANPSPRGHHPDWSPHPSKVKMFPLIWYPLGFVGNFVKSVRVATAEAVCGPDLSIGAELTLPEWMAGRKSKRTRTRIDPHTSLSRSRSRNEHPFVAVANNWLVLPWISLSDVQE